MVLDKLSSSLKNTLQKIAKSMFVDEKLINELIKDIQRALLQADVNVKLVFDLTKSIKERAKEEAPRGLTKKEQLINIVYEELTNFLGKEAKKIEITEKPFKIMLVGLFGSGKTTTAGKLARFFAKRGYSLALVGLDVHRPAAMEQIEQISKQASVPFLLNKNEKDSLRIWNQFKDQYNKYDVLIIDTAGRDALSRDLIEEIETLSREINPNERLLVISADIGQAAQKQAEQFHKSCNITGVIATKMDGTAKAGGALSACAVTEAPIKFIGVGEKIEDLEIFNPPGFVGRLLGMGDLEALLEKAKEVITEEEAEDLGKKFLKGEFNLIDLYEQMNAMKNMGPLSKVMEMIPGFSQLKLPKEMLQVQEGKLENWRHAMDSMTKEELEDPEIISAQRIDRIAKGSGLTAKDIRELIKQYRQSKKLVKMMKGKGDINKLMKKMGGKLPKGLGM
ncbi:signal recognition particle protein Srp54 [Candidatus Woesearchaeota archaeon]|nr:signal recognition particle protein Srp54 [Candidatus Woesearchaeota archaeon]